jgi:hypothetical protein
VLGDRALPLNQRRFFGQDGVDVDLLFFCFCVVVMSGGFEDCGVHRQRRARERARGDLHVLINSKRVGRAALFESRERKQRPMRQARRLALEQSLCDLLDREQLAVIGYWFSVICGRDGRCSVRRFLGRHGGRPSI